MRTKRNLITYVLLIAIAVSALVFYQYNSRRALEVGTKTSGSSALTASEKVSRTSRKGTDSATSKRAASDQAVIKVEKGQPYLKLEELALYIHQYHELPPNFMTKAEAQKKGWDAQDGNLWKISKGSAIGGDRFGNREGLLPKAKNRVYYECDVNYKGGFRDAERLIYSNDGLIYYTKDHYKTFKLLYGEP